jgi:hypothetical protein
LTQPETHKTKVKIEYDENGKEKIVTERKDNPEHVGLFLPETSKIKTEEVFQPDGTKLVKTKEGTEHMGLATQPETHKIVSKVEGQPDGSKRIEKEVRYNDVQIGLNKPKVETVKTIENVDSYGHKTVEVTEGKDHLLATDQYGNDRFYDSSLGHHDFGSGVGQQSSNTAGYGTANTGNNEKVLPGGHLTTGETTSTHPS